MRFVLFVRKVSSPAQLHLLSTSGQYYCPISLLDVCQRLFDLLRRLVSLGISHMHILCKSCTRIAGLYARKQPAWLVGRNCRSKCHSVSPESIGAMRWFEKPKLQISSAFDSGNIEVVDLGDPSNIQLKIRPDPYCEADQQAHFQWFHYQVTGAAKQPLTMHIVNAGESSYPSAWSGYRAVASYDMHQWFRVDTSYDEGKGILTIQHTPTAQCVRYAYFAPYSWERHAELIMRMQHKPNVQLHLLGQTLDGRDLHLLQVGTPGPEKATIWVIARQHPGESMAEWFAEGLLERLTADGAADGADTEVTVLLNSAVLYIVPNMCPDGSVRGHLRTNACGANLNREWAAPSMERSPEVSVVSSAIAATGLDMLLDVHGDEEIPANFCGSMFGVPAWGPRLERMQNTFLDALLAASPDFQTKLGYPLPPPNGANLSTASKANAQRYNTLSLVLEMPFKDTIDTPNAETGWDPLRAKQFGAAHVTAFTNTVPTLLKERATKDEQN